MTSSLLSLPQELFDYIVNCLPRKYASTLLATSKSTYAKGTCAFNKNCFRIIPAELSCEGLHNTEKILDNTHARYIRTIYFKACERRFRDDLTEINNRLVLILAKALQVSPKFKTITYYQNPNSLSKGFTNATILGILAGEVEKTSTWQNRSIKVRLENLNSHDLNFLDEYPKFLELVFCIKLRFDAEESRGHALSQRIQTPLSLTLNLKELFISVDDDRPLYQSTVLHIMASLDSTIELESLTIKGFFASSETIKQILQPFQTSLKKLNLERAYFEDNSLVEFINYIRDHFSLDYIHFSDIGQEEHSELIHEAQLYGGSIKTGLDILISDVLSQLTY